VIVKPLKILTKLVTFLIANNKFAMV